MTFSGIPLSKVFLVFFYLGLSISLSKSSHESASLKYLGVNANLDTGVFSMIPDKAENLSADIQSLLSLDNDSAYDDWQYFCDKVSGKLTFYSIFYEREASRVLSSAGAKFRLGRFTKEQMQQAVFDVKLILNEWLVLQ